MPGGSRFTERELAVLESVLSFYDKFAERNETNSQLQVEAAKAYRKVAALYRVFGRPEKAEEAQARALKGFESLVARRGDDPECIYQLARTLALDGPGAHEVPTERAEPDLRRAIALVESLFDKAPSGKRITYAAALARWKARLASRLDQIGRSDEAVAGYRASIAHDEWLADQISDPAMVRGVLARNRDALARILIRVGRRDEARPLLDLAAADLLAVAEDGRPLRGAGEPVTKALEDLATSYDDLGNGPRAIELRGLAKDIRARCQTEGPGPRVGGGFSPRRGGPYETGRGEPPVPPPSPGPGHAP
jgi:tetratricopeptide (TPR) repeat protein